MPTAASPRFSLPVMRRCCRRLGPELSHWLAALADGSQAARRRQCHQRDLGPWAGLGKARAGLQPHVVGTSSFTAPPYPRPSPSSPRCCFFPTHHTHQPPSPTLCFCLVPTCGPQFRAWPLQPSPAAATAATLAPSPLTARRSLTAASAPTALKNTRVADTSPRSFVPARDQDRPLSSPAFHPPDAGCSAYCIIDTAHTLVPVIDTVICCYTYLHPLPAVSKPVHIVLLRLVHAPPARWYCSIASLAPGMAPPFTGR